MILSPNEDFATSTLAALPSVMARLCYLGDLRQQDGSYQHWGLERCYGAAAANNVIAEAHTEIMLQVLRLPLRQLWEETCEIAEREGCDPAEVAERLLRGIKQLTPRDFRGGTIRHFNSVLDVLSALAASSAGRTRSAA